MAIGKMLTASAFEVEPGQADGFKGGAVGNLTSLASALSDVARKGQLELGLPVSLNVDTATRASPVRTALMNAAFGKTDTIVSCRQLAARLGAAMDNRSDPCLLILSVHEAPSSQREVGIWTFPKQQVFHRTGSRVDVGDAFVLVSKLRKAALLAGKEDRNSFLTARVLDAQTTDVNRVIADFWVLRFLDARMQIGTAEGTANLAKVLRVVNGRLDDVADQEVLHGAIAALRVSPRGRWTIADIANDLVPEGRVRDEIRRAAGTGEEGRAVFSVDREQFDRLIQYRVFVLEGGVRVSAPFSEIGKGKSVTVTSDNGLSYLQVTGPVASEKLNRRG